MSMNAPLFQHYTGLVLATAPKPKLQAVASGLPSVQPKTPEQAQLVEPHQTRPHEPPVTVEDFFKPKPHGEETCDVAVGDSPAPWSVPWNLRQTPVLARMLLASNQSRQQQQEHTF
jgi:hypothetical protein